MGSGIALLLWTAKLPSPFLFWYHRYVSIFKYNTAGVCLAIKKAMPVNGHRLFDYKRTRCNGDHGKIGSPYRQPSPRGEGAPKGRIGHWRYEREREGASQVDDLRKHPSAADAVPLPRWGRQISSGYAANIYGAMPESLSISGFPFWTFQTLPT